MCDKNAEQSLTHKNDQPSANVILSFRKCGGLKVLRGTSKQKVYRNKQRKDKYKQMHTNPLD